MLFLHLVFPKIQVAQPTNQTLDLIVKTFAKDRYILDSFSFGDAMKDWNDNKVRYVVDC
jgi:hypothetical protein